MAKFHESFKLAMDRYGVRVKDLASYVGVSAQHITEFRQGRKWVSEETLESLLENMDRLSPGSKKYFCELLANKEIEIAPVDSKQLLVSLIDNASADEIEAALLAIGRKWSAENSQQRANTDSKLTVATSSCETRPIAV